MSRTTRVPRLDLAVLSIDAATALSSHASTAPAAAPVAYVKKVKVILVGDAGTGKSCLVMRLATGRYPSRLPLQSGADARAIVQHDVGRERITVHWVCVPSRSFVAKSRAALSFVSARTCVFSSIDQRLETPITLSAALCDLFLTSFCHIHVLNALTEKRALTGCEPASMARASSLPTFLY